MNSLDSEGAPDVTPEPAPCLGDGCQKWVELKKAVEKLDGRFDTLEASVLELPAKMIEAQSAAQLAKMNVLKGLVTVIDTAIQKPLLPIFMLVIIGAIFGVTVTIPDWMPLFKPLLTSTIGDSP